MVGEFGEAHVVTSVASVLTCATLCCCGLMQTALRRELSSDMYTGLFHRLDSFFHSSETLRLLTGCKE